MKMQRNPNPRDALDAARSYLARGWAPVPVPHREKGPQLPGWQRLRLTETDLPRYFNGHAQNIGILLGAASGGLVDVDLDCPEALALADHFLPPTAAAFGRASKPRAHRLYRCDPPPRTTRFRDPADGATLVEARADGCQTVCPPSVHPSGEAVRWDAEGEPAEVDGAALLQAVRRLAAAVLLSRYWPARGARHDAAMAVAGALLRAGWSADEAEAFIAAVAEAADDEETRDRGRAVTSTAARLAGGGEATGLPRLRELIDARVVDALASWLGLRERRGPEAGARHRAAADAADSPDAGPASADAGEQGEAAWPPRQPLPQPLAVPTLPAELLPPPLRPWLLDVAERASIPLEFVAAPAIVGLGAAVGRGIGIQPARFDDFIVVPNLWGGIVGPPGWLKTHAVQEALRPLTRLEAEGHRQYDADRLARAALIDRIDAEIAALKEQMRKAARPGKPSDPGVADLAALETELRRKLAEREQVAVGPRRFITQDATVEKLGELLKTNPRGLLVLRDELAGWLRTLDKPGREGDREFYLESWNGTGSYTFDRIGRGTIYIPAVCISIVGSIQPGKLRSYIADALSDGAGADGLLQRLQVLVWPDSIGTWRPVDRWPNSAARRRADAIYERLAGLDPAAVGAVADDADQIAVLHFDAGAQELYDAWRTALENRLRGDELAGAEAFQSHISKYRSLMPALALLFHLVSVVAGDAEAGPVTLPATRLAAAWCDFLEAHARKVYHDELDDGAGAARLLAEKIGQGRVLDGMTVRDVYRHHWTGLATPAAVDRALATLTERGWLRVEPRSTGGRPEEVIRLHPDLRGGAA